MSQNWVYMTNKIASLHYLTQDIEQYSHEELVEIACKNGIKWIQLRVKNKDESELHVIAEKVRKITLRYNCTLIINDNASVAKAVKADGVHLGKNDMPIEQARKILGYDRIIGATANSIEDVLQHKFSTANYIGFGPFKHTTTKKIIAPILGIETYKRFQQKYGLDFPKPIIAIGGIQALDVVPLSQTGIAGIAVSSAIHHGDIVSNIKTFLEETKKGFSIFL
jgi:thiamine-phosphate pyrophosphorylase